MYIDSALNVVYPYHAEGCDELVAFLGHTDVVFPDTDELPVRIEGDTIYGPGIGDDTANAVAVMEMARMVTEMNLTPKTGILFVLNTGEEGLGNLKGVRQVMEDYKGPGFPAVRHRRQLPQGGERRGGFQTVPH